MRSFDGLKETWRDAVEHKRVWLSIDFDFSTPSARMSVQQALVERHPAVGIRM
jgi:hypothetical protein